ncbi:MAG: oligosaccharide flippase family protein [Candidatus Fournierella pullistercoris]|uniref:Oligosaccharide flippase family protein n=1 Tax=Candidatus Allofournierella pullistercoris TaxID=2838597 RepID=A0A948WRX5_9FIRM|nr:oligosaccharide flippase family protein [Candidatus Fournierella pullistercoris]
MLKIIKKYNSISVQAKAAIWYTVCNLIQKGISLIAIPLYTRILTPEQYGSYTVFLSWLEIFEIIATFRISWGGYIVGLTKYEHDRDRYTSSVQCLGFTLTSIVLAIYLIIPDLINSITGLNFGLTLMIFSLLYTTPSISFWTARQRVEYRYQAAVAVTMISSILIPILGVAVALTIDQKQNAIIGARVLVHGVIGLCLMLVNCHKRFCFFNKEYWKRSLKFNGPLLPYYLSTVLLNSSDRIIIQNLVGKAQAGIYGVAYSASMVMSLFNSSINSSLQPWIFAKMKEKQYKEIPSVINSLLVLVAGVNLMLIAFAPEAIAILAPPQYAEAIWVVPPLAASVFVMFFYQHFVNIEFYFEDSKMIAIASIGSALLNVALNYLLIPVAGYLIAGYTTLLSYLVFAFAHYVFMRRICKKNGCPVEIVNIRQMCLIMLVFFILMGILTFGYTVVLVRYGFILIVLATAVVKRNFIVQKIKELKK